MPNWRSFASKGALPALLALSPYRAIAQQANANSDWEFGAYPTLQVVSTKLAGKHVWGGGLNFGVARKIHRHFRVEAAMTGAFAPQLNYRDQATLNSLAAFASIEAHTLRANKWDPYIAVGVGRQRFVYDDAPKSVEGSVGYTFPRAALGLRMPITSRVQWRSEISRQFGSYGPMQTFISGASFSLSKGAIPK